MPATFEEAKDEVARHVALRNPRITAAADRELQWARIASSR